MNGFSKFIPLVVSAFFAQASMILYYENSYLRRENGIHRSAADILRDQVSELNASVSRLVSEKQYVATRGYVLGATQAVHEPRKFGEIWHDGYNKGLNQVKYAAEHESEEDNLTEINP